jgi:uncharacterized protein (TIGR03084 family)
VGIFEDLKAEHERLEAILSSLDQAAWRSPSGAPGWSVADVVLHLAQTDEFVVATTAAPSEERRSGPETVDEVQERWVREQRAEPEVVFERWKAGWRTALAALRAADPKARVRWAAWPLKPPTLATTRVAEHWAHGLDITGPLGIDFPDTDRLHHSAWLGHRTLPYAFGLVGEEAFPVRCDLTGPSSDTWAFGPEDAPSRISGSAGAFCRVGAQRLAPEASGLTLEGPHAAAALRVLRNYAA